MADPANRGKLLDRGLRRCSRRRNYFGNACLWWTAIGPTLMTFLLLEVSGISLLEKSLATLSRQIAGQACWPQLGDAGNTLAVLHIGQQAAQFLPDYCVALAHTGLKSVPFKH